MVVYNTVCALAVVATFGILAMVAAFWCGVVAGRVRPERTLVWYREEDSASGGTGVSVDFCPSSPDVASTSGYAVATPLRSSGESGRL